MSVKVYLADLRYNYSGVLANDCMPLGVAYMKAVMDRDEPEIDSRLFVYPDKLQQAIVDDPPDVLMVSNYVWNEELSFYLGRFAKRVRPDTLVVMGGPNITLDPERQIEYVARRKEIDIYVLGEADFLARDIVREYMDAGKSLKQLGKRTILSSLYRDSDGNVVRNELRPRHKEVEEIPSPWLTGIQDEFFDGKLAPMIETNRGCPFSCTFCCQGTGFYTKVHNFDIDRMKAEILHISKQIKLRSPNMGTLRIADSNYGMFERDVEISGYIGQMQRDYGYPTFIDATTGKNRPDRIIRSVEQVSGALVLYQAVQSLDEDVLRKIKRQTIKLEAYEQLQVHMRGRGLRSTSDLILGLPGESLTTHMAALRKLLDTNIDQLHNFQAMMLKGAEMETQKCREEFKFDTRFRVLPKNFGVYSDEKVIDVEEIVVGTDTLPYHDYITARKYHLNSSVFWNDSWFEAPLHFVRAFNVKASEWWGAMLPAMENGRPEVQKFLSDFVAETNNELFPTREACIKFYEQPEHFAKLGRGEIGDNLMYKYRAIASFHLWPEICATAMDTTKAIAEAHGIAAQIPDFEEFWQDFHTYVRLKHACGLSRDEILASTSAELRYDFEAWIGSKDFHNPQAYRLDAPRLFTFQLNEEAARELAASLNVWTVELKGLTKMVTRIKVNWQIRDCVAVPVMASVGTVQ